MRAGSGPRVGRRRSTTQDHITDVALDLFAARGFDEVSVDDVAQAAGIARRTLFRYYASKNAIPWGDFDAYLDHMRDLLDDMDPDVPISEALRSALLAFNEFGAQETMRHRRRMRARGTILPIGERGAGSKPLIPRMLFSTPSAQTAATRMPILRSS